MKAVIFTQYMENYGAHDWDGQGECPQRWKYKGGDCFIVELSIEQNQSKEFWEGVASCIEYKSDYEQMYMTGETIVDDIDFKESDFVDHWESPIYCIKLSTEDRLLCKQVMRKYDSEATPYGERSWSQNKDGKSEPRCFTFEEMEELNRGAA
jgi:hypothetical protein